MTATGVVYRLVRTDPPTSADFITAAERRAAGSFNRPWSDDCEAAAVSVYQAAADVEVARKFPGFKNRKIAAGDLGGSGVMKPTPRDGNSHHSWWRPIGDVAWSNFAVVP